MKKSRVVLAVVLAVILVIVCVNAPTFSWFTRPQDGGSGEKLMLQTKNTYTAYNGKSVTTSTSKSATGVLGTYSISCDGANSENLSAPDSNSEIAVGNRNFFCTTITNSSRDYQNVSLYARTLSIPTSSNGSLAIGVNGPTRSYHDYSSLATPSTKTTRDMMRIYFEKDNNVSGWNGTEFYICWNESSSSGEALGDKGQNGTYTKLTHVGGNNNPNQYYADIPKTATHAFFCVENWGTNDGGNANWGQRSQELCNLATDGQTQTSSKCFKITSAYKDNDSTSNHLVHTPPYDVTGNCINSYYSNIFVATGNTFNAALSSSNPTEYIGTLKYYSGNTSVFTVNENTGVITPVAAGTATLYTKSQGGSYPDSQQVETTVTVTSAANYVFYDVPIVKNIQIPVDEQNTDSSENVVKVYWYVINNSKDHALKYTIDQVYLGL